MVYRFKEDSMKLVKREFVFDKNKSVIKCGNSVELLKYIPENVVDCIITDPPYRTTARGDAGNSGGMLQKDINKKGLVFDFNDTDCTQYSQEFYRVLKDGGHCYVMTNHVNLIHMLNTFTETGFHFIKSLIWNKGNKIMGQYYMSAFEYILFFRKGKGVPINNCGTADILSVPNKKLKDSNGKNLHDTEKPVDLMKILIENSTKPGEVVLDPFVGIGAVAVAAKQLNRIYYGFDMNEKCCIITDKRLKGELV